MEGKPLPSVSHAFARIAWRTVVVLLTVAVGLFAIAGYRILHGNEQRHLREQTLLCSDLTRSGDPAELREAAAGLQAHARGFVAIGVFNDKNELQATYPDSPRHRAAVASAVRNGSAGHAVGISPDTGRATNLVSIAMPEREGRVTGSNLFAIFQSTSRTATVVALLLVVGFTVAVIAVIALMTLRRWFERHVAGPLRSFGSLAVAPQSSRPQLPAGCGGAWQETAKLAETLQDFISTLAETDERARRMEEDTVRRLRDREAGFDRQLRRFRDQATTDPLTKLRNRAFMDEAIVELFNSHAETGEPLAAVMMDLDNFKNYNDTFGHQAGDALLRFVGALLRGSIRPTDHAVRYGGDEFLLLLPQTTSAQAASIAERSVKLFRQYSACLKQDRRLSMSGGVAATGVLQCKDGLELIAWADRALYAAKAAGRDSVYTSTKDGSCSVVPAGATSLVRA